MLSIRIVASRATRPRSATRPSRRFPRASAARSVHAGSTNSCDLSIQQALSASLERAVREKYPSVRLEPGHTRVTTSPVGDYRSSLCFALSKLTNRGAGELARELSGALQQRGAAEPCGGVSFSRVLATGEQGGFLTFFLEDSWILNRCLDERSPAIKNLTSPSLISDLRRIPARKKFIIDHGSPNMSKELHAGHLRSIMIGDCLARVLRHQGHHVDTVSHVGDFGAPIALVIAQALKTGRKWAASPSDASLPSPEELSELYASAKKRADGGDDELQELASLCLRKVQRLDEGDPVVGVWKKICRASRLGFDRVYEKLNVRIEERGESWYASQIPATISDLKQKNLLQLSNGAWVCTFDDWKSPMLVEKSDSSWLYGTTDLACLRYRLLACDYDHVLYVVDYTQKQHFEKLFRIAKEAGWQRHEKTASHVSFGTVLGLDGKKLSSRTGSPYTLDRLLEDAVAETKHALRAAKSVIWSERCTHSGTQSGTQNGTHNEQHLREPQRLGNLDSADLVEANAPIIAYNAVKYFELSQSRTQNYVFSFQSMLCFKGNTCFYIVYAYARIHTLFKKAVDEGISVPLTLLPQGAALSPADSASIAPQERDLALKLLQLPDAIRQVELTLMPHFLSSHLFQTAQKFHAFYESCKVIHSPHQRRRLLLCRATELALSTGLRLLNVQTVQKV